MKYWDLPVHSASFSDLLTEIWFISAAKDTRLGPDEQRFNHIFLIIVNSHLKIVLRKGASSQRSPPSTEH